MGHTNHDRRESGSLQYPRGKNQGYSGAFSCSVNYCGTNGRLGRALVKTAGGFAPELADAGHCGGHGSTKDSGYVGTCRGYPTLCNPIDGSPPGSPVPGILQARTLEWVAISFSNA